MLAMEIYLKSLHFIKIKVCDDKFDFEDPFGIEFPTIDYYFTKPTWKIIQYFDTFYKTLKTEEVKEKFKDLVKAVDDVLYIEFVN